MDEERNVNAEASKDCGRRYCDVLRKERGRRKIEGRDIYLVILFFSNFGKRYAFFNPSPLICPSLSPSRSSRTCRAQESRSHRIHIKIIKQPSGIAFLLDDQGHVSAGVRGWQ